MSTTKIKFELIAIGEINKDFGSNCIEKYLCSKHEKIINWSHVGILIDGDILWDSTSRGFRSSSLKSPKYDNNIIRRHIRLNVENDDHALGWLCGFKGTPYAIAQYLLFLPTPNFVRNIFKFIMPKFILNKINSKRSESFCSESTAHFIRDNCVEGNSDSRLDVSACDIIDPYDVMVIAESYIKNG